MDSLATINPSLTSNLLFILKTYCFNDKTGHLDYRSISYDYEFDRFIEGCTGVQGNTGPQGVQGPATPPPTVMIQPPGTSGVYIGNLFPRLHKAIKFRVTTRTQHDFILAQTVIEQYASSVPLQTLKIHEYGPIEQVNSTLKPEYRDIYHRCLDKRGARETKISYLLEKLRELYFDCDCDTRIAYPEDEQIKAEWYETDKYLDYSKCGFEIFCSEENDLYSILLLEKLIK
jgi:hypothetical protein